MKLLSTREPQAIRFQPSVPTRADVIVIGGGNAALVAAISAREQGCSVLLVERTAENDRGGNTRHTRNIRCVHMTSDRFSLGEYRYDELWNDLCGVGSGPTNERLASLTVRRSEELPSWMSRHGIRWQAPLTGTLQLGRTNRFFLGGGKALLNRYYQNARRAGIRVAYESPVEALVVEDRKCLAVRVREPDGGVHELLGEAVVCASGGYESNLEWLSRYWGDAVRNFHVRGPRHNDGTVLRSLYDAGALGAGDEGGFHAVAVDARSPRFDGGIATRIDAIPLGIVVNRQGLRFYDEGEDLWPKRYAIWGGLLAQQGDQIGYCLWDSKVHGSFLPPLYGALCATSVQDLAVQLGLDPVALSATVKSYNDSLPMTTSVDRARLDGSSTSGLTPPKSNWSQRLDTPPYYGTPLHPGITFTYRGVAVDDEAHIMRNDGVPFDNLFAAGEIMSGNILSTGYLAGFGMTIGTVWGRIAGDQAGRYAAQRAVRGGSSAAQHL